MIPETDRANSPVEIKRPFSVTLSLLPHGAGVLLDNRVILTVVTYRHPSTQGDIGVHTRLYVTTHRRTPIAREAVLDQWQQITERCVNMEWGVGTLGLRVNTSDKRVVFVGEDYKITHCGGNSREKRFLVESIRPITVIGIGTRKDLLEGLEALTA